MRHLRNLGNQLHVSLPTDGSGYLGRECQNADCKGYFKIVPGTGLSGVADCHCPYCGHTADQSEFSTPDQVEYAKSIAIRKVTDAVVKDLKGLEFDSKPKGAFGIGLSMKVEPGRPQQLDSDSRQERGIGCQDVGHRRDRCDGGSGTVDRKRLGRRCVRL
jgi:hypothetical protein